MGDQGGYYGIMGDVLGIKEDILGLRSALGDDVRCGIKEDVVGSLEDIVIPDIEGSLRTQCSELCPV